MYWTIYIFSSLLICSVIASINKKYFIETLILSFAIFITPAQIDILNLDYAPSLFTFLFNLILEQNLSLRPLRPLVITIPTSIAVLFVVRMFKRKFF
tara:strand:- start:480 stop:770 length:291 start_codon:yes stop_codon:yes gene_type:complete